MLPVPVSPTLTPPSVVRVVLAPVRVMVPVAPAERPRTMLADVPSPELTLTNAPPERARLPLPAKPTSKPPVVVATVAPLTLMTPLAPALWRMTTLAQEPSVEFSAAVAWLEKERVPVEVAPTTTPRSVVFSAAVGPVRPMLPPLSISTAAPLAIVAAARSRPQSRR